MVIDHLQTGMITTWAWIRLGAGQRRIYRRARPSSSQSQLEEKINGARNSFKPRYYQIGVSSLNRVQIYYLGSPIAWCPPAVRWAAAGLQLQHSPSENIFSPDSRIQIQILCCRSWKQRGGQLFCTKFFIGALRFLSDTVPVKISVDYSTFILTTRNKSVRAYF